MNTDLLPLIKRPTKTKINANLFNNKYLLLLFKYKDVITGTKEK